MHAIQLFAEYSGYILWHEDNMIVCSTQPRTVCGMQTIRLLAAHNEYGLWHIGRTVVFLTLT